MDVFTFCILFLRLPRLKIKAENLGMKKDFIDFYKKLN